jgi:CubicO group peptidase (beta-lactamase class C family)
MHSGPPTSDDLVWIASITKTFTSTLLHIMRDEGVVSLEDPVAKYFTGFQYKTPWPSAKPMTLGQLASHTSGLPRETPYYHCDADPQCKSNTTERERRILTALSEQVRSPHGLASHTLSLTYSNEKSILS